MGASLKWTDQSGDRTLFFDVVTDERWASDADVTDHPAEKGANVTDNHRVKPDECTLTVVVTPSPLGVNNWDKASLQGQTLLVQEWPSLGILELLGPVGSIIGNNTAQAQTVPVGAQVHVFDNPGMDYVKVTLDQLQTLRDTSQLITVIGTKKTVENMVITSLSPRAGQDTGRAREVGLTLREIRYVTTSLVNAPKPTVPRAKPPASKGNQATTDASTKTSLLKSIISKFAGSP